MRSSAFYLLKQLVCNDIASTINMFSQKLYRISASRKEGPGKLSGKITLGIISLSPDVSKRRKRLFSDVPNPRTPDSAAAVCLLAENELSKQATVEPNNKNKLVRGARTTSEMDSQPNYQNKQKLLFDSLLNAEKSVSGTTLEQRHVRDVEMSDRGPSKVTSKRFRGKESIFKRPAAPINKCLKPRRAPDFQVSSSVDVRWWNE